MAISISSNILQLDNVPITASDRDSVESSQVKDFSNKNQKHHGIYAAKTEIIVFTFYPMSVVLIHTRTHIFLFLSIKDHMIRFVSKTYPFL